MALRGKLIDGKFVWTEVGDLDVRLTNAGGNTGAELRRFCREHGIKPSAQNVDAIRGEVTRTQGQNEKIAKEAKELGVPMRTNDGVDHVEAVRSEVKRRISSRE